MDTATVQRFIDGMKYETARTGPPEGFPSLPDIPAGRYTDPAFLKLENEFMWHRSWLYACHLDELPERGSFILWKKTGTPILIVRGKDDVVRAFYNTCRHRGGPLVKSACGKVDGLVCGYHGWTYTLDGRLINLRDKRDFPNLDMSTRNLIEVRCERFLQLGVHQRGHVGGTVAAAHAAVPRVFSTIPARTAGASWPRRASM